MQTVRTAAASAVLGIILLPFPSQTLAQQTPTPQPSVQQPSGQQSDLNDTQLRSFAKIYVQVEKILKTYDSQLKEAKTPEESKQIQNEEMSKVNQVLAQEGMDQQSYSRIVQIANADDGLRKKLVGFINEERQKS
jgi:Domain of unknown function (DUF4168)